MKDFIEKLKKLKETLTGEDKNIKLYFYIPTLYEEQDDDYTVFYINDEENHLDGILTSGYPYGISNEFFEGILELLDAAQMMEGTYEYYGSEAELKEKIEIIQKELPNVILTTAPFTEC